MTTALAIRTDRDTINFDNGNIKIDSRQARLVTDSFAIQGSVHDNVRELRGYLGSHNHRGERTVVMPRDDLAALIAARHPDRKPNGSTVQRWEEGTDPDITSIAIMAGLAGVPFEKFALGKDATWTDIAGSPEASIQETGRTAPVAQGFKKMSSKALEAEAKKPKRKKA